MRKHFQENRCPLYCSMYALRMGTPLREHLVSLRGTALELRQILSAHRNTRFRLVRQYSILVPAPRWACSRPNISVHRVPKRLTMQTTYKKKRI